MSFFVNMNPILLVSVLTVSAVCGISIQRNNVKADNDTFDWRTKGVISGVSDQGFLGYTYPIVIAEGVESLHAIQNQLPVNVLSRQEVEDCCTDQMKYQGYDCIIRIGGLCTESEYHSLDRKCRNDSCEIIGKVTKSGYILPYREDEMLTIINFTPISAFIDASQPSFTDYVSGIYLDPNCSREQLDHMVQIVGYGTEAGHKYWIIKNSWGIGWGEKGYMRIERGTNMCGIATKAFFPIYVY